MILFDHTVEGNIILKHSNIIHFSSRSGRRKSNY